MSRLELGLNVTANKVDRLLTLAEAAKELGVSERTMRRLIDRGELPVFEPSKRKRWIFREDLDAFIESHRRNARGD